MGGEKVKADEAASVFREEIQKKVNDFKAVRAPQNPKAVLSFFAPSLCSRCDPHAHAPRAAAIFFAERNHPQDRGVPGDTGCGIHQVRRGLQPNRTRIS